MGDLHLGHLEPGLIIEYDSGILQMQTFRKLPIHAPKAKTIISSVGLNILFLLYLVKWVHLMRSVDNKYKMLNI